MCFAIICAWTGERELALGQLEAVTKAPGSYTYGDLRLNPMWDPLRGDPRFEKIVASLAPKECCRRFARTETVEAAVSAAVVHIRRRHAATTVANCCRSRTKGSGTLQIWCREDLDPYLERPASFGARYFPLWWQRVACECALLQPIRLPLQFRCEQSAYIILSVLTR